MDISNSVLDYDEHPRSQWRDDRKFVPAELYGEDVSPANFEHVVGDDFTYVGCHHTHACRRCGAFQPHWHSIIIAIDGACRNNGREEARSSIGVYFSPHSRHNISGRLHGSALTNQKAELEACLAALEKALEIRVREELPWEVKVLEQVVIKSDSAYVVRGMTGWVFKWRENGYKNYKGATVTNAKLFRKIDHQVEKLNDHGVEILFWLVPRSENMDADHLANLAFVDVSRLTI